MQTDSLFKFALEVAGIASFPFEARALPTSRLLSPRLPWNFPSIPQAKAKPVPLALPSLALVDQQKADISSATPQNTSSVLS